MVATKCPPTGSAQAGATLIPAEKAVAGTSIPREGLPRIEHRGPMAFNLSCPPDYNPNSRFRFSASNGEHEKMRPSTSKVGTFLFPLLACLTNFAARRSDSISVSS